MSDIVCDPGRYRGIGSNLDGVESTINGHNTIVFSALEIGNYRFTGSSGNLLRRQAKIRSQSPKKCMEREDGLSDQQRH